MSELSRTEQLEKEVHLLKHRMQVLEEEQLPRRVASMEPVVRRVEHKLDDLSEHVTTGLDEVRAAIMSQRAMIRGALIAIGAIVGFIQLLPIIKELLP